MVEDAHELILDHLRHIREEIGALKAGQKELKEGQISIRDEIHSIRGDFLRQERAIAALESDFDRIKTRLDIVDAP